MFESESLYSKLLILSNSQLRYDFIVSIIPNAHSISIVHPVIPTIAIRLLPLFLPTSLKFHLVEIDAFLNIPFVVKSNFVFLTFGISSLKASTADSFSILLHDKYVTRVINTTTAIANIYTTGISTVLYTGTSK